MVSRNTSEKSQKLEMPIVNLLSRNLNQLIFPATLHENIQSSVPLLMLNWLLISTFSKLSFFYLPVFDFLCGHNIIAICFYNLCAIIWQFANLFPLPFLKECIVLLKQKQNVITNCIWMENIYSLSVKYVLIWSSTILMIVNIFY